MRLRCLQYQRPGRCRVERGFGKHLMRDAVQVRLPLPLQDAAAPHVLSAHHILQHRLAIGSEPEDDKGLPEDGVLRVKGENPQRQVRPVSLSRQTLKLFIHHQVITDPAPQALSRKSRSRPPTSRRNSAEPPDLRSTLSPRAAPTSSMGAQSSTFAIMTLMPGRTLARSRRNWFTTISGTLSAVQY